ncbi:MAG: dienelactone hydrolase family protein [Deltaproteobacteria bacterium]|nr:dienelactone hydrolase family protein [Deltaproteobacteria bacterium]
MKVLSDIEEMVHIDAGDNISIEGALGVPKGASAIVLFAHGSGSSRWSPRNNLVAGVLRKAGLATLLMDLLTREEDSGFQARFDIDLLTGRLAAAARWVASEGVMKGMSVGYFGASTGAAAAIKAAVRADVTAGAIVSRGGRVDLAGEALIRVKAPTLLIVGGRDEVVVELNRAAFARLKTEKELVIVPGASHLFEEPGALEEVALLAAEWFRKHLMPGAKPHRA